MSRRREFALVLAVIVIVAWMVAPRRDGTVTGGPPSIYETGPAGAQGFRDLAERRGVAVRAFRQGPSDLARQAAAIDGRAAVVLEPRHLSPSELGDLLRVVDRSRLVVAGAGVEVLIRCFGYRRVVLDDSVRAIPGGPDSRDPLVGHRLEAAAESVVTDSSRASDASLFTCTVPAGLTADTLLRDAAGRPVAVEVSGGGRDGSILIVADAGLFRNRVLRETTAAAFVIPAVIDGQSELIVDEYHHGHSDRGSMVRPLLAWSFRSPWGWMIWQAAAVGLLALLFGAIRFGPVEPVTVARRRAPAEHLGALATALAASGGHDEAVAALVRGLRRRLAPEGALLTADWRAWLGDWAGRSDLPRQKELLAELVGLTGGGQTADGVRRAAIIVEELWAELHH